MILALFVLLPKASVVWVLSITIIWPACYSGVNGSKDQQLARKVSIVMPKPAHVNISAAAVSRFAKNRREAIQLIEFLASPKGRAKLAGSTYEFPLRGIGSSVYLKGMTNFTPDRVSVSQLSAFIPLAIQLMTQSGRK